MDNGDCDINHFVRDRVIGDFFVLRDFAEGRFGNDQREAVDDLAFQTDVSSFFDSQIHRTEGTGYVLTRTGSNRSLRWSPTKLSASKVDPIRRQGQKRSHQ